MHKPHATQPQEGGQAPIGVVTVDDQAVFRRAAREVIDATAEFESLGEAATGKQALALADELAPDLVLLDVRMPGIDGIETARRLCAAYPDLTIVLISTEDSADLPAAAHGCGAAAFLRKEDFGPEELRRLWTVHGRSRGPRDRG